MAKKNANNYRQTPANEKKGLGYYVKKILINSCIAYTLVVLLFAAIILLTNLDKTEIAVPLMNFVGLYPLALLIAVANLIFTNKKLTLWVRVLLHFICVFIGCMCYVFVVNGIEASSITLWFVAFAVIYSLIMIAVLVILGLKNKTANEESEYNGVYTNVTNSRPKKETDSSPVTTVSDEGTEKDN